MGSHFSKVHSPFCDATNRWHEINRLPYWCIGAETISFSSMPNKGDVIDMGQSGLVCTHQLDEL